MTLSRFVFDRAPLRVYWEITRACDLACLHCRAEARPERDRDELTTSQALTLLDDLLGFAPHDSLPRLVFTGGDPLKRADLFQLINAARDRGFKVSISPSATPLLTPGVITRFRAVGVEAISLSLDGSSPERHDAFRGVTGTYDRTLAAARMAELVDLPVQVNTLVAAETLGDLPEIYERVRDVGAARWSLFFLVTVGRGAVLQPITPRQADAVMRWAAGLHKDRGKPIVTTTEAPHFRRISRDVTHATRGHAGGVRDGNGILFISHTGDVTPAGFLPTVVGNVKGDNIVTLYRAAPLFVALRHPDDFGGRCGRCELRWECGGSRARALAATGDPLAEDPLCSYIPGD
ncbi:MAG TPA: radical SAM protein [Gemmatimonadales bacterium]|nr:radical SAM protein [Gemmatimonadales bacterium]